MNVSQGSWVCREPGAALQASPYRLQSALGQGVGEQSRLLSLELASKQASGHISNELVVTFWTTLQEALSCWVQQYLWVTLGTVFSSKSSISSEPKLCVEWILCYSVWPWDSHMLASFQHKLNLLFLHHVMRYTIACLSFSLHWVPGQYTPPCTHAAPEKQAAWRSQVLHLPGILCPAEVLLIYSWSKQATSTVLTTPKPTLLIVINIPEWEHRGGAESVPLQRAWQLCFTQVITLVSHSSFHYGL